VVNSDKLYQLIPQVYRPSTSLVRIEEHSRRIVTETGWESAKLAKIGR
jgi:hypothetical protein